MFAIISGSSVYFYLPSTVSIRRLQHIHNHVFTAQPVVCEKLASMQHNETEGRNLL